MVPAARVVARGPEPLSLPPPPSGNAGDVRSDRAFLLLGGAFAVGYALAKGIDWLGHAHPRG